MLLRLRNSSLTLRFTGRRSIYRFSSSMTTDFTCFQNHQNLPMEVIHHLYWMKQKYALGQDIYLCGHPGSLRRNMVTLFANINGLEVEYLCITRDTTESDLKQRREIYNNSVVFHDQAPVKAAIHGRLLILDGIEHAERNVLPALNNLLENREMNLEDGRFLMRVQSHPSAEIKDTNNDNIEQHVVVPVHPNFRVIALGCNVPPYDGRTMDPPLRSRFQSRFVDELTSDSIMQLLSTEIIFLQQKMSASRSSTLLSSIFNLYESLRQIRVAQIAEQGSATTSLKAMPLFSLDSISHCLRVHTNLPNLKLIDTISRCVPAVSFLNYALPSQLQTAIQLPLNESRKENQSTSSVEAHKEISIDIITSSTLNPLQIRSVNGSPMVKDTEKSTVMSSLLPNQVNVLSAMLLDYAHGRHLCVLGVKGSGKSYLARAFAHTLGQPLHVFPLYQEFTSRDLLQRRITKSTTIVPASSSLPSSSSALVSDSMTSWVDSPLITATRNGGICLLDGVDKVDVQTLFVLRTLLQDGYIALPSGEVLSISASDPRSRINPSFRVVALGLLPKSTQKDECRVKWISSSLGFIYHVLPLDSAISMCPCAWNTRHASGATSKTVINKTSNNKYFNVFVQIVTDFESNAVETPELQLSMRQFIRAAQVAKSCERNQSDLKSTRILIFESLERLLLVRYLPSASQDKFYRISGLTSENFKLAVLNAYATLQSHQNSNSASFIEIDTSKNMLRIGSTTTPRRHSTVYENVPQPLFFHSPTHDRNLESLLRALCDGERALLVIGNQGVGKNKLVDRLLQLLNAEREYVQLHRESTVQSLTVLPSLENGQIVYKDSPLIRAAKEGTVLVVDEADKAPVEVVSVLKSLAEDGEVQLYDGRRLLSKERYNLEKQENQINTTSSSSSSSSTLSSNIILIHPNFQLIVLANRPGFPFLGNNLFRECGDVFSVHVVENLDLDSEVKLLQAYGPSVDLSVITKLAQSFADLREANEAGHLMYPFSVREAVSVVKHIQAYPEDSIATAIECVIAFDALTPRLRAQIVTIFNNRGIKIPLSTTDEAWKLYRGSLSDETIRDRVLKGSPQRAEGGASTPKTGLDTPKFGKVDPKNEPHVGGNQWAGGTGGLDTAGLGGRGGPYRLDKGHTAHQVSDEMKNQVSQQARDQAKRMAAEALANRLKDISMGKADYKTFINFKAKVDKEIDQLRTIFDELSRRSKERVWLRHQSQGDLDDGKLVDGMTGERMVFKRRGYPESSQSLANESSGDKIVHKKLQFVVDVSASMYRFNGLDRRLERMLEAMLMVLEALPTQCNDESLIDYSVSGHSGDSDSLKFVDFDDKNKPTNEKEKLNILESMAAHTQYTLSGDNTLPAIRKNVRKLAEIGNDESTNRFCFVITDANFDMYGISAEEVSTAMTTDPKVAVHLILIASLQDEAERLAKSLPSNRVHICYQSTDLPGLFRNILTSASGLLDT